MSCFNLHALMEALTGLASSLLSFFLYSFHQNLTRSSRTIMSNLIQYLQLNVFMYLFIYLIYLTYLFSYDLKCAFWQLLVKKFPHSRTDKGLSYLISSYHRMNKKKIGGGHVRQTSMILENQ